MLLLLCRHSACACSLRGSRMEYAWTVRRMQLKTFIGAAAALSVPFAPMRKRGRFGRAHFGALHCWFCCLLVATERVATLAVPGSTCARRGEWASSETGDSCCGAFTLKAECSSQCSLVRLLPQGCSLFAGPLSKQRVSRLLLRGPLNRQASTAAGASYCCTDCLLLVSCVFDGQPQWVGRALVCSACRGPHQSSRLVWTLSCPCSLHRLLLPSSDSTLLPA